MIQGLPEEKKKFLKELGALLNSHSIDNDLDTPDYMLATYLANCLENFGQTVKNRDRLVWKERPTGTHDGLQEIEYEDKHQDYQLRLAARCYMTPGINATSRVPDAWPWDVEWWKPSDDPIKNLVRAGALIAAEIARMNNKK